MTWRYELCRQVDDAGEDVFAIHEVYYEDAGGVSWSLEASFPMGSTWKEFQEDFARYQQAALTPESKARNLAGDK